MDDTLLPDASAPAAAPEQPRLIAPWWHTAAVLLILVLWATLSGSRKRDYTVTPHIVTYISMMMMSWMLFGSVVAGVTNRRDFFFSTLRNNARTFRQDLGRGLSIYLGVYAAAVFIVAIFAVATHSKPPASPAKQTQSSPQKNPSPNAPLPPPAPESPLPSLHKFQLHFENKTQLALAPTTLLDFLFWIGISFTAGFCEEHIFRGYLLKQAIALAQRAGMSRLLSMTLSVVATSLIFGSLHLYEGTGGALLITSLGVVFSVLALKFGNLRAVIAAHFFQDFFAGVFLFFFHARLTH